MNLLVKLLKNHCSFELEQEHSRYILTARVGYAYKRFFNAFDKDDPQYFKRMYDFHRFIIDELVRNSVIKDMREVVLMHDAIDAVLAELEPEKVQEPFELVNALKLIKDSDSLPF